MPRALPMIAARDVAAKLHALREALVAAHPESRGAVARLIAEAEHSVACACAAAGVHPTARADAEEVRHA